MVSRYKVIEAWTAAYDDPIKLVSGETARLTGKTDIWDGHRWLWARNAAGKEGWVPDTLIAEDNRSRANYSAKEITLAEGDIVEGLEATHGWIRCRTASGDVGWAPARNLEEF